MTKKQTAMRFLLVGAVNTVIDFGSLFLLVSLGSQPLVANTISTGVAFTFSFFANRRYTFQAASGSVARQMTLFIMVTLFGLWAIQPVVIWLISPLITAAFHGGLSTSWVLLMAKAAATAITLIWNYVLYAKAVFRP